MTIKPELFNIDELITEVQQTTPSPEEIQKIINLEKNGDRREDAIEKLKTIKRKAAEQEKSAELVKEIPQPDGQLRLYKIEGPARNRWIVTEPSSDLTTDPPQFMFKKEALDFIDNLDVNKPDQPEQRELF